MSFFPRTVRDWNLLPPDIVELDTPEACNFREKETFRQAQSRKCLARYHDVTKTTCGIRQSNYLPLLLYRIPLSTPFLKEGEIHRRKKCSERLKELDRKTFDQLVTGKYMTNFIAHRMAESGLMFDATSVKKRRSVKRNLKNVSLVTTTSRKQHAVFGKVIICPCYCIVWRRIVELKTLAEQLNACDCCDLPLNLMNIEQERLII
jgi:hypothetical protein